MNTLLKEFKAKVLSTNESFTLNIKEQYYYHFIQTKNNNVKFIYGDKAYNGKYSYMNKGSEFKLCAIVKDNSIYIIDDFIFDVYSYKYIDSKDKLEELNKENIYLIDIYYEEIYEEIENKTFKDFYDGLEVDIKISEDKFNDYKQLAISKMLSQNEIEYFNLSYNILNNVNTYIKHLSDVVNIFDIANELFNEDKQHWIYMKTKRESIQHIIDNKEKYFTKNEINFINAIKQLKELNCKTIVAEFEFDGNRDKGKILLNMIENKFICDDNFYKWNFQTEKEGDRIYKSLGINNWDDEKQFRCDKITKITYRGKDVYVREDKKEN